MSTIKLARWLPELSICNGDEKHFHQLDFLKSLRMMGKRLYPDFVKIKGEVQTVNWYASAGVNPDGTMAYSDLIISEGFVYTRDPNGFALFRDGTITWYCEGDTVHPEVKTVERKFYPPLERIQERKTRRTNIIDELKSSVLGWIIHSEPTDFPTALSWGQTFFAAYQDAIAAYIQVSNATLQDAITNDTTTAWLDNTIQSVTLRAMMLDAIDI